VEYAVDGNYLSIFARRDVSTRQQRPEAIKQWQMHGRREEIDSVTSSRQDLQNQVSLLTNG